MTLNGYGKKCKIPWLFVCFNVKEVFTYSKMNKIRKGNCQGSLLGFPDEFSTRRKDDAKKEFPNNYRNYLHAGIFV